MKRIVAIIMLLALAICLPAVQKRYKILLKPSLMSN